MKDLEGKKDEREREIERRKPKEKYRDKGKSSVVEQFLSAYFAGAQNFNKTLLSISSKEKGREK